MKINLKKSTKGLTLIEMTIVILIILSLIGVLFIGFKFYKDGADKATCLAAQSNVQKEVRSYQAIKTLKEGAALTPATLQGAGLGAASSAIAKGCPGNGTYNGGLGTVPGKGVQYLSCSGATPELHTPSANDLTSW